MYFIIGNYGNNTIALLQWVIEKQLKNVFVISVETGWSASGWIERVVGGEAYAHQHGIQVVRLKSAVTFSELVKDRNVFPNQKFPGCVSVLKGIPINDFLDERDPEGKACILLAKRRSAARVYRQLPEFVEQSEYYNGRRVWHPLCEVDQETWQQLILRTKIFSVLPHRSLECEPCIYSGSRDFQRFRQDFASVERLNELEKEMSTRMFPSTDFVEAQLSDSEMLERGCGSHWGCGD